MSYNHGREERKWQRWKLAEEKVLRACGMDESTIEQLHLWDRAMFNSDRRFYEKLQ
ncbi:MAG: sigma-70 family RNA polymerase sigma factor, partial [Oscillospiraceae bacterium]|nr:sigma-70 family RNA polymerase sigma factor [Oscillospiraceae bacterium]